MTIEEIVLYFFVYMFEGMLLWNYCSVLFEADKKRQMFLLIEAVYAVLFLVSFNRNPFVNTGIFMLANYICICVLYRKKWHIAIFHVFVVSVAMEIGELLAFCVTLPVLPMFYPFTPLTNLFINALLSKLTYFIILSAILNVLKGNANKDGKFDKIAIFVIIVPMTSVILTLIFLCFIVFLQPEIQFSVIIIVCTILVLMFNLIVTYMYHYILKKNNDFTELQIQLQKENDFIDYHKMLIRKNEDQNIIIHDIKRHLQTILIFNEHKEYDKITEYVNQIIQKPDLTNTMHISDNDLLNAIINRYQKECQTNHIAFYTDIRSNTIGFIKENDITSLFCNLLDNAFEAAIETEMAFIELNIERKESVDFTIITMVNSCKKNPISSKTGKLVSEKQDNRLHGFGLKSIERIVDVYQGKMQMYYDEESRTFHSIIMLKDSSLCAGLSATEPQV